MKGGSFRESVDISRVYEISTIFFGEVYFYA